MTEPQEATVARRVPQRRTSRAMAVLVGALVLSLPPAALAAPVEDRPPTHAGSGDPPPPHAHSDAPEDRPPAHARARRTSARHGGDGPVFGPAPAAPGTAGPSGGPHASAPPRHAAPGGGSPPEGAPAHGHRGQDPDPATDDTELDTDRVVEGAAPAPDRAPLESDGPVLPAPPPLVLVAASVLGVAPSVPLTGIGTPAGGDDATGADAGGGEDPDAAGGPLAAPRTRSVPPPFDAPELTRHVVVPVVVLVAGLAYLLAQGRIDRRAELLLAPVEPGTEHDEDVFEL